MEMASLRRRRQRPDISAHDNTQPSAKYAKIWMISLIIMFAMHPICVQDSIFKMFSMSPGYISLKCSNWGIYLLYILQLIDFTPVKTSPLLKPSFETTHLFVIIHSHSGSCFHFCLTICKKIHLQHFASLPPLLLTWVIVFSPQMEFSCSRCDFFFHYFSC